LCGIHNLLFYLSQQSEITLSLKGILLFLSRFTVDTASIGDSVYPKRNVTISTTEWCGIHISLIYNLSIKTISMYSSSCLVSLFRHRVNCIYHIVLSSSNQGSTFCRCLTRIWYKIFISQSK